MFGYAFSSLPTFLSFPTYMKSFQHQNSHVKSKVTLNLSSILPSTKETAEINKQFRTLLGRVYHANQLAKPTSYNTKLIIWGNTEKE
jgi:hypothetical protein